MSDLSEYAKSRLTVEQQFELAKALAANCGYDLVERAYDRRKDLIRRLIKDYEHIDNESAKLIIEGLEGLLK